MAKRRANGEGSIRKRKDRRWEGRYTTRRDPATGKPTYKNVLGKTQAAVKEKLKQAIETYQQLDMSRASSYIQWKVGSSCGTRSTPSRGFGKRPRTTT